MILRIPEVALSSDTHQSDSFGNPVRKSTRTLYARERQLERSPEKHHRRPKERIRSLEGEKAATSSVDSHSCNAAGIFLNRSLVVMILHTRTFHPPWKRPSSSIRPYIILNSLPEIISLQTFSSWFHNKYPSLSLLSPSPS